MPESPTGTEERTAYLGLGSNLGDRLAMLRSAVAAIDAIPGVRVDPDGIASLYETAPVGGPADQPPYLNTALRVFTSLTPDALLNAVQKVETYLGRVRGERWGPRLIDIDILLFANITHQSDHLTLPHPRLHQRRFVLEPLAEIAPEMNHPIHRGSISDLAARMQTSASSQSVRQTHDRGWVSGRTCDSPRSNPGLS